MLKPIDRNTIINLIESHKSILKKLTDAINMENPFAADIIKVCNQMISEEIIKTAGNISVEEINRFRSGIRVKALRDSGYNNIADIFAATEYSLASITGISVESAYHIKDCVKSIYSTIRQNTKIKLSADQKTETSTRLVVAISKYRIFNFYQESCKMIYGNARENIEDSIKNLSSTLGLKWFFSSESKKMRSLTSFKRLDIMINGDYNANVHRFIDGLNKSNDQTEKDAWKDFSDNSILFYNVIEKLTPELLDKDDSKYGLPEELAREIQDECYFPDGLNCELRRYQEWGVKYILHQKRVLLGDEMGLGKTIQAIATMVSLKNTGATHFMVVCPAGVLANWCREIRVHSKLSVTKIHGKDRIPAFLSWKQIGGVAVTTFETTGYLEFDSESMFSLLVVDEAHYIKNSEAQRTINIKNICLYAERLLFMTGTPIENNVDEMISLIEILQPKVALKIHGMEYLSSAPLFREKISPVYYRRKREDVLAELPELIEIDEWCSLSEKEELAYENSLLSKNFQAARQVSWNIDNVLESSKARRMLEIITEAELEERKIIVFSYFRNTVDKIVSFLTNECYGPINGAVSPDRRQEIIDDFNKAPPGAILISQIEAGGTGLNIQSASVVIICEPQLKPSTENQAISRAYRMGQARNVIVHRLLCEDTIDERISELLRNKQTVFDAFADKSVAAEKNNIFDDKMKMNLIKEEIDRINSKHKSVGD